MKNQKIKQFFSSFGFWLCVISFAIAGLIILVSISYNESIITGYETKTSREMALTCTTDMATKFHIHPILKILIGGTEQTIPTNIGINALCMNSIHTHDTSGALHVESPVKKDFTLGDFFAVWAKEFNRNQILDYKTDDVHTITVTVNGKLVDTYENTEIKDKDNIVIEYKAKK